MKYLQTTLLVALALFVLNGCSKKDEPAIDKTTLLTQKLWTFSAVNGLDEAQTEFLTEILAGSSYKFNTNGSVDIHTKYGAYQSNWKFNNDKTIITFDSGTIDEYDMKILTLNETTLILKDLADASANDSYTYKNN